MCDLRERALIAVVEDEPAHLRLVSRFLKEGGYEVLQFEDGEVAATQLCRTPVDLVLADFAVSGLNGIDLILVLRESSPDTAFILFSGKMDADDVREAFVAGAADVLLKPIERTMVLDSVRTALQKRDCQKRQKEKINLISTAASEPRARSTETRGGTRWIC